MTKNLNITLAALGVLVFGVIGICFLPNTQAYRKPNIVLLSIDTLRGDYFSPENMPKTYQWAKKNSTIYERAYANATWTFPSHVSMLTGKLPKRYGPKAVKPLSDNVTLISEALKDRGYHTYIFGVDAWICPTFNFAQGFDEQRFFDMQTSYDDRAIQFQWAIEAKKQEPFFIFIHTIAVHQYWMGSWEPSYSNGERVLNLPKEMMGKFSEWQQTAPIEERKRLYKESVTRLDESLVSFLRTMSDTNTIIIITSDHGEGLGEKHGDLVFLNHGQQPYPNQAHVPLIVSGEVGQVNNPVGLNQLFDAILQASDKGNGLHLDAETVVCSTQTHRATIDETRYVVSQKRSSNEALANIPIPDSAKDRLRALGYIQ